MATTGKVNPTAFSAPSWTNGTNVLTSNNARATRTIASTEAQITVWGFGFAIPAGSVIDGIILYIEGSATVALSYAYHQIVNADTGVPKSVNTKSIMPGTSETIQTAGSSSDVWGGVDTDNDTDYDRDWSTTDINTLFFGAQVNFGAGASTTLSIDHIALEIYYHAVTGVPNSLMLMGVG